MSAESLRVKGLLIGESPAMQQLYKMIARVCAMDCAILLIGEKGSGKKAVAHALHELSPRGTQPMWDIEGKQIRETNDEELLGIDENHVAETTCYITDYSFLPGFVQHQLVEIHRTREFKCVHTGKRRPHKIRFVVATEGDIKESIESGALPADLFYDWNFLPVFIPPLRDRKEDIPLLATRFLELAAAELRMSHRELSPEAMDLLREHDWPGNLTELRACMQSALEHCRGNYIRAEHLPELKSTGAPEALTQLELFLSSRLSAYIESSPNGMSGNLFRLLLPEMEQAVFQFALKKSKGNRNRASQYLGVHRNTLNKKLQTP